MTARRLVIPAAVALVTVAYASCASPVDPAMDEADSEAPVVALVSVTPAVGSAASATSSIEVRFDGPLDPSATSLIALQVGACPGPVVGGSWRMSDDRMTLSFTPMTDLMPGTMYTIHLGGGIRDALGRPTDIGLHGPGIGGEWVTLEMAAGMGAGMGSGMGMGVSHTGAGWLHPTGMYGLGFSFVPS